MILQGRPERTRSNRFAAIGALALIAVTGCLDLEVTNPNEPDADRALATPGDIEALVAGSYNAWFNGTYHFEGLGLFLSNASPPRRLRSDPGGSSRGPG